MRPTASHNLGQVEMHLKINSVYICVCVSPSSSLVLQGDSDMVTGQCQQRRLGGLGREQEIRHLGLFPS